MNQFASESSTMKVLFGLLAIAVGAVAAVWIWGVPLLAGLAVHAVPPEWERQFGALAVAQMVPPGERVTDPRVTAPVQKVFALLLARQPAPRDRFELIVMRAKLVNAFAAPGGYVVVTTGLLGALDHPDELAAVLAHEITHVEKRHSTRQIFARLGLRTLIAVIVGDQGVTGALGNAAGTLSELSNSRSDETEADAGAVRMLARAGIDPRAADRALGAIAAAAEAEDGKRIELAFLSTHPGTRGRRARVRALAEQAAVATSAPLPDAATWRTMRRAAGAKED